MSVMWTIIGFIAILAFLFLIFAVAAQSDHMPNYDEEYASDFFDEQEDDMY